MIALGKAPKGQDWIGPELSLPPRTVSRILRPHDTPYLRTLDPLTDEVIRSSKATAVRYEGERPGRLVHVDVDVKKIGLIPAAVVLKAVSEANVPTSLARAIKAPIGRQTLELTTGRRFSGK